MPKRIVKLRVQNGLTFDNFKREVLDIEELSNIFEFKESTDPDFIIFGPYGADIPKKGTYVRIGYYCENVIPDTSICDWAFGVMREEDIKHAGYKRIQWHNLHPQQLVKPTGYNPGAILASKTKFCNFLYSNKVAYRENFFKELSKYKKIDAPGRSMNNMESIDELYTGDTWQRKRQFLSEYKFTISFENYVYPGYQTEKLYDAMLADSIPVYCGDPNIGDIFNTNSFVDVTDYISTNTGFTQWLGENSQNNFIDILPQFYHNPLHRAKRKIKSIGRNLKMSLQYSKHDLLPVIERIIELDEDDAKYMQVLKQPWFNNNTPPRQASNKQRWIEIFGSREG